MTHITIIWFYFRVFVLVLVGLSILWVPIIKESQGTELFVYIQEISSFLQPPIIAVFMAGLFWSRANELVSFIASYKGFKSYLLPHRLPVSCAPIDYNMLPILYIFFV